MQGEERRVGPADRREREAERRAGSSDRRNLYRRGQGRYDRRDREVTAEVRQLRTGRADRRVDVPIRRVGDENRRLAAVERRVGPTDRRARPAAASRPRRARPPS
jgi:hypothetical protein